MLQQWFLAAQPPPGPPYHPSPIVCLAPLHRERRWELPWFLEDSRRWCFLFVVYEADERGLIRMRDALDAEGGNP